MNEAAGWDEELEGLRRFYLAHQGHFSLALVRANDSSARTRMMGALEELLKAEGFTIVRATDGPSADRNGLFGYLSNLSLAEADGLMVGGLDDILLGESGQKFVRQLNIERDALRRFLGKPLTIWLGDTAMDQLVEEAPDFADWHGAMFRVPQAGFGLVEPEPALGEGLGLDAKLLSERADLLREQLTYMRSKPNVGREAAIYLELCELLGPPPEGLGRLEEAIEAADQAIALLEDEPSVRLGLALYRKGRALNLRGRLHEAEAVSRRSIEIFEQSLKLESSANTMGLLAEALRERANCLRLMDRLVEALADLERAVGILMGIRAIDNSPTTATSLAKTLIEKSFALFELHPNDAALQDLEAAISLLRPGVTKTLDSVRTYYLGRALNRIGEVLQYVGRLPESIAALTEAISLFRSLDSSTGTIFIALRVAEAIASRSLSLAAAGRDSEALDDLEKVKTALKRLDEFRQTPFSTNYHASILNRCGRVMLRLDRPLQAIEEFGGAVARLTLLFEQDNRSEYSINLGTFVANRGVALRSLTRLDEAAKSFDEAIQLLKKTSGLSGRARLGYFLRERAKTLSAMAERDELEASQIENQK